MLKYKPYKYQLEAMQFMLQHRYNALFLDMGLGKTVITLTFLKELMRRGIIKKPLIIAPLKVAQSTWNSEIDKWNHLDFTYSKILGTKAQKLKALEEKADIYIINVDSLKWLYHNLPDKNRFDYMVLDELSMYKNKESARFKYLMEFRPYLKGITGLTGTPAPNSLLDLWAPICLLDLGKRFSSYKHYLSTYFTHIRPAKEDTPIKDSRLGKYKLKPGQQKHIYEKLSDLALTMKAVDYIDMPRLITNYIPVTLSSDEKKVYDDMEMYAVTIAEGKLIDIKDMIALSNKLAMLANGRVYNRNKETIKVHDAKLTKLKEIVDTAFGKSILVFSNYICDTQAILETIPDSEVLTGNESIVRWNKGLIPVMVANPKSCGHGLNLQDGGHIAIWYSMTWSLEQYQQANARLYRQGQASKSVIIHHIYTKDTMDEIILNVLDGKYKGQNELLTALKKKIEKVKEKS